MCWWSTGIEHANAPDHRGDSRRPHAGGVDDGVRLDPSGRGDDRAYLAARAALDAGHEGVRADVDAERPCRGGDGVRGDVRIDVPVAGHPDRAVQRLGRRCRHQPPGLLGADQLGVEADAVGAADTSPQLEVALGARGDAQAADGLEDAQLGVELDAVAAEAHHRLRRVELGDQAGRVVRRPARQLALLDEHDVRHTRLARGGTRS